MIVVGCWAIGPRMVLLHRCLVGGMAGWTGCVVGPSSSQAMTKGPATNNTSNTGRIGFDRPVFSPICARRSVVPAQSGPPLLRSASHRPLWVGWHTTLSPSPAPAGMDNRGAAKAGGERHERRRQPQRSARVQHVIQQVGSSWQLQSSSCVL